MDSALVETYLKVFREIFRKSNHLEHHRMMMGNAYVDDLDVAATDLGSRHLNQQ